MGKEEEKQKKEKGRKGEEEKPLSAEDEGEEGMKDCWLSWVLNEIFGSHCMQLPKVKQNFRKGLVMKEIL